MDREKVIRALEICTTPVAPSDCASACYKCSYSTGINTNKLNCIPRLLVDALALLKEQDEKIRTLHVANDVIADYLAQPEIVRCKECKNLGYTNSHWFCKWLNRCVDEDWFCADGERKEGR